MSIRIYNTLAGEKEVFTPLETGKVRMYVCGPTVYDSCHIGHARSVVVFDVVARYFRMLGFDVTYVRNFTDVDDKIINRANEPGSQLKWNELAEKYIKEFHDDMDALHVERATLEPKATEHIDHIIKFIEELIKKRAAYQIDQDVYFAIDTFKAYGKLSGRRLEDMEAGARIEIDTRKRNPFDFALWKSAKSNEPFWDSPWGKGRPGWHIECSAMSSAYLGQTFDIHGGGKDLIFPHHENEIAQSEAVSGKPFAKYWMHNGFVNINNEKMSKSLGNFKMIKDILKTYHPEAVRLFLLSNHYRSPIDFADKAMDEASTSLDRLYALLDRIDNNITDKEIDSRPGYFKTYWDSFCEAMNDDFNTALGIGLLFNTVHELNRIMDQNKQFQSLDQISKLREGKYVINCIGSVLGILSEKPKNYFANKKNAAVKNMHVDSETIEKMIDARAAARKSKDFAKADQIRMELEHMNVILEDRPDGTIWKIKES